MHVTGKETVRPLTAGAAASRPTSTYVWYVVGLLTVVNIFNILDRTALAMLLPAIKAEMHLSDSQIGLLIGFGFSLFFALCGIPIARWADRGIRRDIIALAITTWSLMTALTGAAQNFLHLLLARMGVGAGEAGSSPAAQSLICDYVPLERRPAVFAILASGMVFGGVLGAALTGWLGEAIGWRWTFVALGLPGIAVALIIKFTLREPARTGTGSDGKARALGFLPALTSLLQTRTYVLLVAYSIANAFIASSVGAWLPSFYMRVFELSMTSTCRCVADTRGAS